MGRIELGDTDHIAARTSDSTSEIEGLVEDRRIGRLHQGNSHLPADGNHRLLKDIHRHHVHRLVHKLGRLGLTVRFTFAQPQIP